MVTVKQLKSTEEYNEMISKSSLSVIKIGAEWCVPCKIMRDRLSKLDALKTNDTSFAEIDADDDEFVDIIEQLNVRSIPVIVYFKDGNLLKKSIGLIQEDDIYNTINELSNVGS